MKRLIRIAPVVLALCTIGSALAAPPSGFKSFASSKNHYQIVYPSSWTTQAKSNADFFYGSRVHGFATNVNVFSIAGAGTMTAAQLEVQVVQADQKQGAVISSRSAVRVAGTSGYLVAGALSKVISGKSIHEKFAEVVFVGRGKAWEITYSVYPTAYNQSFGTFKTMYSSFAFTK